MNREYVIRNDIVERYLRGQLSVEETAAFEEHCLWCSESLEELDLVDKMRQGFRDFARIPAMPQPRRLLQFLWTPQFAAAAAVLLSVTLFGSGVLYRQLSSPAPAGFASGQVYSLEAHRGPADPSQYWIEVPEPDARIVLLVYPDGAAVESYRVSLYRAGQDDPVWQDAALPATSDALAVVLPGSLLSPGIYRLRIDEANAPADAVARTEIQFTAFSSAGR